jgi:eukaryotic-like serine/threonine-protein kinase
MTSPESSGRWRAVQRVVDGALDLPPGARAGFLDDACGADAALRESVVRLLDACERAERGGGILDAPAAAFAGPLLAGVAAYDAAAADARRDEVAGALREALRSALAGRYAVERELGRGGMAMVYLAHDLRHDRAVAVKVLAGDMVSASSTERFLHEVRVAARLTHPHVLSVHDSGGADGLLYYVMPYVDGETLRTWLARDGPLPLADAVRLLREIADALAYAHGRGVMHRDLKPENVLLSGGHAVVADFGIAKALATVTRDGHPRRALTSAGVTLGTPAYMAPEQVVGGAAMDHRADLYALGVIAYEVLAGAHPFGARSPQDLVAAHLTEAPAPLDARCPDVPPTLAALVMRLLAKDPAARPQSADAVLRVLDDAHAPTANPVRRAESGRRRVVLAAVAGLVVATGVAGYAVTYRDPLATSGTAAPAAAGRPSVAVLPFQNTSGDSSDAHFADGLTDELIGALGKVAGLRTAGRTSAFALKGTRLGLRAVAETLGVGAVLEGSVRRDGGRLKVGAQLVSAADGAVLWTESYDRELSGVFAVQEEIARAIVGALRVQLGATAGPRVHRPTSDSAAYDLYLKGRYVLRTQQGRGVVQAVAYFEQAVARDPAYAAAFSGLSDAYTRLALFGYVPPRETFAKATLAARRALALDSTLAEAHVSLGHVRMLVDFAYDDADREFRRAIGLDPSYSFARAPYAVSLASVGRYAEAIAQLDTVRQIDPLALTMINLLGRIYVAAGRPGDAIAVMRLSVELEPRADLAYEQLGHAYLLTGRSGEAIAAFRRAAALSGPRDSAQLAYAYAVTGQRAEARRVLRALLAPSHPGPVLSYHIAVAYAGLGDRDAAFRWLERGYAERSSFMGWARADPALARLHADPRWLPLLRRMRLPS